MHMYTHTSGWYGPQTSGSPQYTSKGSVRENYFYKYEVIICLFYTVLTFSIDCAEAMVDKTDGILA